MIKIARKVICVVVALLFASGGLDAASTDHQHIKIWVGEDFEMIFDTHTVQVIAPEPVPGGVPADATVNNSYSIYTNLDTYKLVVGMVDFPADPNIELKMNADAPTGAVSVGEITWSSASVEGVAGEQDCITGIVPVCEAGIPIVYTLHCTGIPAVHPNDIVTVNFRSVLE